VEAAAEGVLTVTDLLIEPSPSIPTCAGCGDPVPKGAVRCARCERAYQSREKLRGVVVRRRPVKS